MVNFSYHDRGTYLKPYKDFMGLHTFIFLSLHNKTFRVRHKNILFQIPIQESCLHVHLMEFSSFMYYQREYGLDGHPFHCGIKGFLIFNTLFLCKSFFHEPSFVLAKWDMIFILVFEDPLASNWFGYVLRVHQLPSPIFYKHIIFLLQVLFPFIMRNKFFKGSRFKVSIQIQFTIKTKNCVIHITLIFTSIFFSHKTLCSILSDLIGMDTFNYFYQPL